MNVENNAQNLYLVMKTCPKILRNHKEVMCPLCEPSIRSVGRNKLYGTSYHLWSLYTGV